jgi:hypothetical protein
VETRVAPPGPYGKEGKIGRGWRLTKVAWKLIREDRTMLALAFIGIASATAFTALILILGGFFSGPQERNDGRLGLVAMIALYPSVLVSVFFNVALASAASAAFDGERMSVGEAIRMAWGKRRRIAAWSLISAIVGVVISEIANRLPGGTRLVGWLAGAAWGLATIFVIPILAMEGIGAVSATKRSAGLVKSRWGEGVTGNVAISAWSVVAAIPAGIVLGVGAALLRSAPGAGFALVATGLIALVAISTVVAATRQVFAVALFRYAIDAPIGTFNPADLDNPFTGGRAQGKEKRRSWILRIGVPILGLFFLLGFLTAIFGPQRKTVADGYYQVSLPPASVATLTDGSPVLSPVGATGLVIGSVESVTPRGNEVRIEFKIDPLYRRLIERQHGWAAGPPGGQVLCFGSRGACHEPDLGVNPQRPGG